MILIFLQSFIKWDMNFFIHHAGTPHFREILSHFFLFTCGPPIIFSRDHATRLLMVPPVPCPIWILPMASKHPIHLSDTFLTPLVHQSRENLFAFLQQLYFLAWQYFPFNTVMDFSISHWAPSFSCPKSHFSRYFIGPFFLGYYFKFGHLKNALWSLMDIGFHGVI